jgi:hypothetical protein
MTVFNFRPQANRSFLETLFLGAVVIVAMAFAAVVLHYATSGLWLLAHNARWASHAHTPLPAALVSRRY